MRYNGKHKVLYYKKKTRGHIHTVEVNFTDTTIIVAYTRKQFREASLYALKVMR